MERLLPSVLGKNSRKRSSTSYSQLDWVMKTEAFVILTCWKNIFHAFMISVPKRKMRVLIAYSTCSSNILRVESVVTASGG